MTVLTKTACLGVLLLFCTCAHDPATDDGQAPAGHDHRQDHQHDHDQSTDVATTAKPPLSPHTSAMGTIGDAHVHVDYSSPGKRGRMIWGGLVAYDRVWATGAHDATSVNFSGPVSINGQEVAAGTYGLFTIPGREEWTIILNENYEQHLADDYDEKLDVVRYRVQPERLDRVTESLTYTVRSTDDKAGAISITWDSLRVSLPLTSLQ